VRPVRLCPRCTKVLERTTIGETELDACGGCGGIWFDDGELTTLAKTLIAELEALDERFSDRRPASARADRPAMCPNCAVQLVPYSYAHFPGVTVDACRRCKGVWLDDGEVREICRQIRERQPSPPR